MKLTTANLLSHCIEGISNFNKIAGSDIKGTFDYCKFGIRDPALLMNSEGEVVIDAQGKLTLFFNARDRSMKDGGKTSVGIAHGNFEEGWKIQPNPIFMDGIYAAQGSVLQLASDQFCMYYSPDTRRGFAVASSRNLKSWQQYDDKLILDINAFGVFRMGLPFVRWVIDKWVMFFEGSDNGRFHIYQAVSVDGINWIPANSGKPIYSPAPGSWDDLGQANPSLYIEQDGMGNLSYFILYNGCSELYGWDIGILASDGVDGPWRGRKEPLLRRGEAGRWDSGRIEGARLVNIPGGQPRIVYFGLPTKDSYFGGRIAFASITQTADSSLEHKSSEDNAKAERSFNDKLALQYFDIWDNYPIQRFTTEIESHLIEEVICPSSRVLLLGSGGGRELPVLLKYRCQVTAVDISPQMLAIGKMRYSEADVNWIEADLHHLPQYLNNFDAAVCLGAVFNYLRDPALVLRHARRALKPNGSLILDAINAQHPSETKIRAQLSDGRLRQLYDLGTIKELLNTAGFKIVSDTGLRFFVDMLPNDWNRGNSPTESQLSILDELLALEAKLLKHLPTEQGKFILIHASFKTLNA